MSINKLFVTLKIAEGAEPCTLKMARIKKTELSVPIDVLQKKI